MTCRTACAPPSGTRMSLRDASHEKKLTRQVRHATSASTESCAFQHVGTCVADLHSRGPPLCHCVKANPSCGCVTVTQGGGGEAPAGTDDDGVWQNRGAAVKFAGEGGACACATLASAFSAAPPSPYASSKRETRGMSGSIVDPAPGEATAARMLRACNHRCITLRCVSVLGLSDVDDSDISRGKRAPNLLSCLTSANSSRRSRAEAPYAPPAERGMNASGETVCPVFWRESQKCE